jgi:hypothetical protein
MKRNLASALLMSAVLLPSTFAQGSVGQVHFANQVDGVMDAPVISAATGQGPGPDYTAQLYLAEPGGSLTPLVPSSTFFPRESGAAATRDRYWIPRTVDVPVPPGTEATFLVRTWKTSLGSYERALAEADAFGNGFYGQSAPFKNFVGGGSIPPAYLTGLQFFFVDPFPEPSVLAIATVGVVLMFGARRVIK